MEKLKYVSTWRNKWITSGAGSIDDFVKPYEYLAKKFREWKEMGIKIYPDCSTGDDNAEFYSEEMDVAIKAGFTVTIGDDEDTVYFITDADKEVKVTKEKLNS